MVGLKINYYSNIFRPTLYKLYTKGTIVFKTILFYADIKPIIIASSIFFFLWNNKLWLLFFENIQLHEYKYLAST